MAVKPDAKECMVLEQILEDPVSRLVIQIKRIPDETGGSVRLIIWGDIDFGNREFLFDRNGVWAGSGTYVQGRPKPNWLQEVK